MLCGVKNRLPPTVANISQRENERLPTKMGAVGTYIEGNLISRPHFRLTNGETNFVRVYLVHCDLSTKSHFFFGKNKCIECILSMNSFCVFSFLSQFGSPHSVFVEPEKKQNKTKISETF